jgi:DNA-directed RNA polymerase specialized sigma24 family protein
MQDTFVARWSDGDRVGGMNDPTGYLYRTAMNRVRSRLRSPRVAGGAWSGPTRRRSCSRTSTIATWWCARRAGLSERCREGERQLAELGSSPDVVAPDRISRRIGRALVLWDEDTRSTQLHAGDHEPGKEEVTT